MGQGIAMDRFYSSCLDVFTFFLFCILSPVYENRVVFASLCHSLLIINIAVSRALTARRSLRYLRTFLTG